MESWKKNLYAIWIAEFLALVGFSTSYPIIPFYLQELGVTEPERLKIWVGLCTTGGSLSMAVFAPIWGKLADSFGRKLMLLRAMFGGAFAILLMGFVWHPAQLFILRVLQGILSGTVAAATVMVATTVPEEHAGYAMGLLQTAIFIGGSVGPMIGGIISDVFGYRINFFITAGFLLIAGTIIVKFVHEEFTPLPRSGHLLKAVIPDFSPLKESPELLVLVLSAGFIQAANQVSTPILPLFVQSMNVRMSMVASTSGFILGATALASAGAAASIGKASYRIGYRRTLLICLFGAACFAMPQAFSSTPGFLLVFRIFAGICIGGTMPSINAMIARRTDQGKQGSIYGISASFTSGGAALGPAIGSIIALAFGFAATFVGTGGIFLLCGAVILIFTRTLSKGNL
ncbi:MAG: MFS transporter [Spirochaetales bacterium]|nr:MFS transporter [Spirochaetales bacterium]